MVPLFRKTSNTDVEDEENYVKWFQRIEIYNGFYFSYTYDLTRSLQENMMRKIRNKIGKGEPIIQAISDIYSKDIYLNPSSNPTSK